MTTTIADPALQQIFDNIPERDQTALLSQHGIKNMEALLAKKHQLQQRELKDVCPNVQMVLEVICTYVDSLEATSSFAWAGFENFCDYQGDKSGDYRFEDLEQEKKKREKSEVPDPDGYNLTVEERKQLEKSVEEDPLTIKVRGFSPRTLQFEYDEYNKKQLVEDASDKTEVAFNGNVYYAKKCYHFQQPNGESVTVGIMKFTRNEKKAICALIVPFHDTVMGPGLPEEPPVNVPATYEEDQTGLPSFVQVREKPGSEPIVPLSALKPCLAPSTMPELLYERQQVGQPPHNFGFVYDHDGSNRGAERNEFPFIDLFAGSGGFHQGTMQVPGFQGKAAVEWWDKACQTFQKNNPETPVYCQKVEDFIDESGPTPKEFQNKHGKVLVVLCSPPCQSFSGSNRDVDHNSEKDLYRKGLSLKYFDAMMVSGALVGVMENVEGMWRRPNVYFLKKIILNHLRAGYQVRVRLHRAHVFGDPQARPRLLVYVAKKFVEMPQVVETHGPGTGKHPYMTVGNALKALAKVVEKEKVPNMLGSTMSKPDKEEEILKLDKPAGTIRCGGRAWHPLENRAITVREAATLQSYPPQYEFLGSVTDQYKQVGNAVPGKMAKAVATAIATSLRFVYDEEDEDEEGMDGTVDAAATNEVGSLKEKAMEVENGGKAQTVDDKDVGVTASCSMDIEEEEATDSTNKGDSVVTKEVEAKNDDMTNEQE